MLEIKIKSSSIFVTCSCETKGLEWLYMQWEAWKSICSVKTQHINTPTSFYLGKKLKMLLCRVSVSKNLTVPRDQWNLIMQTNTTQKKWYRYSLTTSGVWFLTRAIWENDKLKGLLHALYYAFIDKNDKIKVSDWTWQLIHSSIYCIKKRFTMSRLPVLHVSNTCPFDKLSTVLTYIF